MDERINVCKDIMKLSPCNLIESVRGNLLIKAQTLQTDGN